MMWLGVVTKESPETRLIFVAAEIHAKCFEERLPGTARDQSGRHLGRSDRTTRKQYQTTEKGAVLEDLAEKSHRRSRTVRLARN